MPYRITVAVFILLAGFVFLTPASSSNAGVSEEAKVNASIAVIKEIMEIPESSIPPSLLQGAFGIAVFPDLLKAGFIGGIRYGAGVLVVRTQDHGWSNPVFFKLTGGSFGLQAGAQSSDVILVFNSTRSLDYITSGKFTLGVDASVAAGPVGRHAEAGTDLHLRAEILSYSRSRGLFAGLALEGAAMYVDYDANSAFYNTPGVLPTDIFKGSTAQVPPVVDDLKNTIKLYAGQ